MPACAFLSLSDTEGWFIDDDLVHEPLRKLGWGVQNIPWNTPTDWNNFELVIIRSPWDYQDHLKQFMEVLGEIDASDAMLLNSLDIVRWNINKKYLFDLQRQDIELVPTVKGLDFDRSAIENAFEKFNTDELIIKPMIGANADDTFRISKLSVMDLEMLTSIFDKREFIIQPFMQHIIDEGEFSLMYFNGRLSHAILKTVKKGDYRVQEEHGGGVISIDNPPTELVVAANRVMRCLSEIPLYARVDLVRTPNHSFALMELELIEPCLYFRFSDKSASVFADCIDECWKEISSSYHRVDK